MIQHIVLRPGQSPTVETTDLTYEQIVGIVGYPVELLPILGGKAVMYAHEDDSKFGEQRNESATRLANGALRGDDHISGTALVVGPLADGNDTSLSDELVRKIILAIGG